MAVNRAMWAEGENYCGLVSKGLRGVSISNRRYSRAVTEFGSLQGETLRREQLVDLFRGSLYHLVFIVSHL